MYIYFFYGYENEILRLLLSLIVNIWEKNNKIMFNCFRVRVF